MSAAPGATVLTATPVPSTSVASAPGEPDDRALARGVVGVALAPADAEVRGDGHDAALFPGHHPAGNA